MSFQPPPEIKVSQQPIKLSPLARSVLASSSGGVIYIVNNNDTKPSLFKFHASGYIMSWSEAAAQSASKPINLITNDEKINKSLLDEVLFTEFVAWNHPVHTNNDLKHQLCNFAFEQGWCSESYEVVWLVGKKIYPFNGFANNKFNKNKNKFGFKLKWHQNCTKKCMINLKYGKNKVVLGKRSTEKNYYNKMNPYKYKNIIGNGGGLLGMIDNTKNNNNINKGILNWNNIDKSESTDDDIDILDDAPKQKIYIEAGPQERATKIKFIAGRITSMYKGLKKTQVARWAMDIVDKKENIKQIPSYIAGDKNQPKKKQKVEPVKEDDTLDANAIAALMFGK